jgi:hypothetical protein
MKKASIYFVIVLLICVAAGCMPKKSQPASTISANISSPFPTSVPRTPTQTAIPRIFLPIRGMFVHQFDHRNYASGYFSGEIIHDFDTVDPVVGHTVGEEVSLQLDLMKQMGVNTIAFELRSSDPIYIPGSFVPPECNLPPTLGLQYPNPTSTETENLIKFFDLLNIKGMKIILVLTNTHMEEQPPTNNSKWIGTILNSIKNQPALELVSFNGNAHTLGSGANATCGLPAEPPLWEGPNSVGAIYVKWAINYANSLGLPWRKLSAEAIIGDYYTMNQAPGYPGTTDNHLWDPITVLKSIFDDLSIPNDQRTYAVSFYEHRKCSSTAQGLPCEDSKPHQWALETVNSLFSTIGSGNGARVIAVEMGLITNLPESSPNGVEYKPIVYEDWNTELALISLVWIMQAYGMEGGCFYRWVNATDVDETDLEVAEPIVKRGSDFIFNPVKSVLENLYIEGQSDDVNLIPDTIPPIFISASAIPSVLKNGNLINFSVNLGQTHHFVTADMSELDSSNTSLEVLIDQGDGTYLGNATLNSWNEAENGIKQIEINAIDFWGNTESTTVDVELENRTPILDAVPPNDEFSGMTLDATKWMEDIAGGSIIKQDGRLVLSTDGKQVFSSARVFSNWEFPGDFDIQVDFQIGEGWARPTKEHLDGAILGVNIAGNSYHITRLRTDSEDDLFVWGSETYISGKTPSATLAGKYRLIRTGNYLDILYKTDAGWMILANTTVPTNPAQVYLGNGSINASQAFTTYFDNFQINSGLTTYRP